MAKVPYIVYRGQKLAMRCGVCGYGEDELTEKNRRCLRCLDGSKKSFVLDHKYAKAKQGELEINDDDEWNEHAQIK
jgi:hypothetical protein